MKEFKGTKGEWFVSGLEVIAMPSQVKISNRISGANWEEARANAELIGSAPELLKELINLRQKLHDLATKSNLWSNDRDEYYDACIKADEIINQSLKVKL